MKSLPEWVPAIPCPARGSRGKIRVPEVSNQAEEGSPVMPIDPRVASGLRDVPPSVMIPRERMLASFRATFASFGFVPIETPTSGG